MLCVRMHVYLVCMYLQSVAWQPKFKKTHVSVYSSPHFMPLFHDWTTNTQHCTVGPWCVHKHSTHVPCHDNMSSSLFTVYIEVVAIHCHKLANYSFLSITQPSYFMTMGLPAD